MYLIPWSILFKFFFRLNRTIGKVLILEIFDFSLSEEEMAAITAMDAQQRVTGIPEDMQPYVV